MQIFQKFSIASFFYSIASFLPAVVNLIFLPIFALHLSPKDFGIYESYLIISTLLIAISRLGMPGAMMRMYIEKSLSKKVLINTCLKTILISSFILCTISFFFIKEFNIFSFASSDYIYLLLLVLCGVFLRSYFDIFNRLAQIQEKPKLLSSLILIVFFVNLTSKLILIFLFDLKFEALVFSEFLSTLVSAVISRIFLNKYLDKTFSDSLQSECLKYGLPVTFHHIGTWMVTYSSSFIIATFQSPEMLGLYAIALKIIIPASLAIDALSNAFTPIYYRMRESGESKKEIVNDLSILLFRISSIAILFVLIGGPHLIEIVFNENYSNAKVAIPALSISLFFTALYRIQVSEIFYQKRTKLVPIITIITGIFNLLISIPLVNEFGLLGASLSVLISSCVQLVLTIILSLRFSIFTIKPEIYIFVILVGTFSFLDLIKTTFVVDISLIIAAFYLIYFFYMIARQLKEVDY